MVKELEGPDPEELEEDLEVEDEPEVEEPEEHEDEPEVEARSQEQPSGDGRTRQDRDTDQTKNVGAFRRRAEEEARERAKEKDRADKLEQELQQFRQNQQRAESPEEEQRRVSLMTQEEKMQYGMDKLSNGLRNLDQRHQFQMWEIQDKGSYDSKAENDPRYAKYAKEVEARLAESRRNGNNYPRSMVLQQIIGERVLLNGSKATKQRQEGQERIRRNTTKPANVRGERGSGGKQQLSEAEARRARLLGPDGEGVKI